MMSTSGCVDGDNRCAFSGAQSVNEFAGIRVSVDMNEDYCLGDGV